MVGDLSWPKDLRSVLPPPGSTEVQVFSARVHDLDTLGPDGRSLTGETGEGSGTRRAPAEEPGGDERPAPVRRDPDRDDDPDDDPDDGSGAETTDDERDPADPDVYDGSLTVDRDGEAHDLDYLVGSRMVGPGRLRTDGVPAAIERSLRGMRPRMPRAVRDQVLAEVDRIARQEGMDPFFTGNGREVTVGTDGNRWSVRVKLSSDRPDGEGPPAYRHVPIREGEGTDAAIIGGQERTRTTASGDTLTRGARRGVSAKFTANPLYFGPTFLGDPIGPSLTVGGSGGSGLRSAARGGSAKATAVQAMDNSAPAEVYTADLRMDLGVTPPAGAPTRAPRPALVRDGMALVLSGKPDKRAEDAPAHIVLAPRPGDGDGGAPRRTPRTLHGGLPIKIERIVPHGGAEGTAPTHTDLGTWLADRLVPDGAEGATGTGAKARTARDLHRTLRTLFDNDSLQEYLPHLSRGPITLKVSQGDGTSRMVRLASSANEYRAFGHAPHLGELTRHDGSEHTVSASGGRSRSFGFSVGGGVNIELSLPGGGMTRIDVPTLEYVYSRTLDSETLTSSRTGSRRTIARDIAGTEDFLAYRVERDLSVHIEGEPAPHTFTGETVEIVSRGDADALDDAAGAGAGRRDPGENPRPPMAHLRGNTVTDLSGTTVIGFERTADDDGAADRDGDGDDGGRDAGPTVYERLQREVLDAVAERHPGMVIPDMARNRKDYALRPGNEEASFGEKKWREVYGLRRNYNVARENTLRVLDALAPDRLHSGDTDLTSDLGLTIDLAENAAVDPPLTLKGRELARPDSVTVHVHAAFGALAFDGRTPTETGVRLGGDAKSGAARGKGASHTLNLTAGAGLLRSRDADARGMGHRMGGASATLSGSRAHSSDTSRGVSHASDDTIFFPGGSDIWRGPVAFTARMSDYEGSDRARGTDQSTDLLAAPIRADYRVITPRVLTESARPGPRAGRHSHDELSTAQARALIEGPFSPAGDGDAAGGRDRRGERGRDGDGHRERRTGGDGRRGERAERDADGAERTGRERGPRDGETPEQARERRRAEDLVRVGGSVERINVGPASRTFELFSDFRRGLFQGFERKLRTYLNTTGGRTYYQELLSPTGMADDPSTTAPSGRRGRTEMSGGMRSPGDVRATTATRVEPERIEEFQQVEMQMITHGETGVEIGTSDTVTKSGTFRVGATGGGSANRTVDEAAQQDPDTAVAPAGAVRPIPVGGFGNTWNFFRSARGTTGKASFTSSTTIVPKAALGYAFRLAGRVSQAVELLHSRGVVVPQAWKTRFRGWTASVQDLLSGYISARDAQEAGIVLDRVTENEDGTLALTPQDDPADITDVRVRPGFEDSGRRVRPADPTAALETLVRRLRAQGYELTGDSRESLFSSLTTRLGNTSGTSEPVAVRVRRTSGSGEPNPGRGSDDARVYVELRTRERKVEYLASSDAVIESHTWTAGGGTSRSTGTGNTVGAEGVSLQPTPFRGDENPPGQEPGSRPLFVSPAASGGVSTSDTDTRALSQESTHTVQLETSGPYAKVEQDSELVLTLRGPDDLRVRAREDSGPIHTLYPYSYLDFSPRTEGTGDSDRASSPDTETGGGDRRPVAGIDDAPAPGRTALQALGDRARALFTGGRATRLPENLVMMPVAVENGGAAVRDTAAAVIARSLGWKPKASDRAGDRGYTAEGVARAREFTADRLHLDRRHSPIDSGLESVALKALFSRTAGDADGVALTDLGSTGWRITALPDFSGARVLDAVAGSRLSVTTQEKQTLAESSAHTSGTALDPSVRPAGLTTDKEVYDKHTGVLAGALNAPLGSTSATAADGRESSSAHPPRSETQRLGPAYLVEFDTTWLVSASAKGGGVHSGQTRGTVAAWVPRSDALRLGLVTPEQAARLDAEAERVHDAADVMGEHEKDYGRERGRLEEPVRDYVRAHGEHRTWLAEHAPGSDDGSRSGSSETADWAADRLEEARQAYRAQEERYRDGLHRYEESTRAWVRTLNGARREFDVPAAERPAPGGGPARTRVLSDTTLRDTVAAELDHRAGGEEADPSANLREKVDEMDGTVSDLQRRNDRAREENTKAAELLTRVETLLEDHAARTAAPGAGAATAPARVANLRPRVAAFLDDLDRLVAQERQDPAAVAALNRRRDALLAEAAALHAETEGRREAFEEQARDTRAVLDHALDRTRRPEGLLDGARDRITRVRAQALYNESLHRPMARDASDPARAALRGNVDRLGEGLRGARETARDLSGANDAARTRVDRITAAVDTVARRDLPRMAEGARLPAEVAALARPLVDDALTDLQDRVDRANGVFDRAPDPAPLGEAERLLGDRAAPVPPADPGLATPERVAGLGTRVADFERDLAAYAARAERGADEAQALRERHEALAEETRDLLGPVGERGLLVSTELGASRDAAGRAAGHVPPFRRLLDAAARELGNLRTRIDGADDAYGALIGPEGEARTDLDGLHTGMDGLDGRRTALETRVAAVEAAILDLTGTRIPALAAEVDALRPLNRDLRTLEARLDDLEVPAPTPRAEDSDGSDGSDSDSDDDDAPPPGTGRGGDTDSVRGGRTAPPGGGSAPSGRGGGESSTTTGDGDRGSRSRPVRTETAARDSDAALFDDAEGADTREAPPAYGAEQAPPAYPYSELLDRLRDGKDPLLPGSGGFKGLLDPDTLLPATGTTDVFVFPAFVPDSPEPARPPTMAETFADALNPTLAEPYSPTGSDQDMLDVHRRYATGTGGDPAAEQAGAPAHDGGAPADPAAQSPDWNAYVDLPDSPAPEQAREEADSDASMDDADSDGASSDGSESEGAPPPVPGDPSTYPGHVDGEGFRRFADTDEADAYGELILRDQDLAGLPLHRRPGEQRRAVFTYTASSWVNVVARAGDRATGQVVLNEWADADRDAAAAGEEASEGWDLYEVNDRTAPTLDDLREARGRPGLTPRQRNLVERVLADPDPEEALRDVLERSGESGAMAEFNGGRYPRLEDAERLMGILDAAIGQHLPEATAAVRTLYSMDHLTGFDGRDPRSVIGHVQRDPGYMSAALGDVPAVVGDSPDPIRIHLRLPAATPFLWVGDASLYPEQREIFLPRRLPYVIRQVRVRGREVLMLAEVLPPAGPGASG
ncbi:hypothetical protein [Nocardiopsis flavescens]|uniref:hypothetical protein n=1 Tax=Nocardiopsis flavescens TaxID=758803 RepID=UPI000934EE27|nr:hypothetical protein [Nocardiopsis flavescens]